MDSKELIEELFYQKNPGSKATVSPLPLSGSNRRHFRLSNDSHQTAIGTYNNNIAENGSYFYFTELFKKHKINVPEIYAIHKDTKHYLQQDLGDESLFSLLQSKGHTPEVFEWYKKALTQLALVHWSAGREADFDQCFSMKQFDGHAVSTDLYYFKYYFLDLNQAPYKKETLADEIKQWSRELGFVQPQTLMYRDFQSRNILLKDGKVWFIDFQGAMQGPPQYDVASLLWQAKAQLPKEWKDRLLNHYIAATQELSVRFDEIHFRKVYQQIVLLRMLQTLGAYGFRGIIERKPHFLDSIRPGLDQLKSYLDEYPQWPTYPEFRKALDYITSDKVRLHYAKVVTDNASKLIVDIKSFSFKNGYPEDSSKHGGGFVFDCRGILNPGRIDEYKLQSGLDEPVQNYLMNETKMPEFLQSIMDTITFSIQDYLDRGFDSLSISFGCTGGQHRSVFAAEKIAEQLSARFGVTTRVQHLNKDNWKK